MLQFIRRCSFHLLYPRHIMFLHGGGRLLLININLSRHGRRKTHGHARLLLRHNNGKLSKSVKQQPM
jgi:hypothetical protein